MNEIVQAVAILKRGGLVAFPTETVYGLGADASNPEAVKKVFTAKGRPYDHPLIVHLARAEQVSEWAREIPPVAEQLMQAFWPGPLTLVLKKQPHVSEFVTGGQDTVGIRIPSHPLAQQLLAEFNGGVVAPSANQFTHVSPTTAEAVQEELGDKVDLILDGGACVVGVESTIVDLTSGTPVILRPGMITQEMLMQVIGNKIQTSAQEVNTTRAPGMHHLHYAPITKAVLMTKAQIAALLQMPPEQEHLAFVVHSDMPLSTHDCIHMVKMPAQAPAYAQTLYHTLRCLDKELLTSIVIEAVPADAAWDAIRDRLAKATNMR